MIRMVGRRVDILRTTYKGRWGIVLYQADPHHLSSHKRRWAIRVFHPRARTLLLQEDAFTVRI